MTAKKILERIRPLSARFVSFLIGFHLLPQLFAEGSGANATAGIRGGIFWPDGKKIPGRPPG